MARLHTTAGEIFAPEQRGAIMRFALHEWHSVEKALRAALDNPETHPFDRGILTRVLARKFYCVECGKEHERACADA